MKFYLAPMEGVTGYIYRNAYHAHFRPMDKYFTPFLAPKHNGGFSHREINDILPEHNEGMDTVPQLLTGNSEDFLRAARELKEYGYKEVNLNLGCPSGTVAAKGKGAGFLRDPEGLELFLEQVCEGMERLGLELSVKQDWESKNRRNLTDFFLFIIGSPLKGADHPSKGFEGFL